MVKVREPRAHAHRWLRRIATVADARPPAAEPAVRPRFYIGIDPGMTGGLAVLGARGEPILLSGIPLHLARGRSRASYDLLGIRAILERWREGPTLAVVERPGPMPPQVFRGGLANYARGMSEGWAWMLVGLGWPRDLVRTVRPRDWQDDMLAGVKGADTGVRAIRAAGRRWPRVDLRRNDRCTTPDLGLVDALLVAEYGRRSWQGGLLS